MVVLRVRRVVGLRLVEIVVPRGLSAREHVLCIPVLDRRVTWNEIEEHTHSEVLFRRPYELAKILLRTQVIPQLQVVHDAVSLTGRRWTLRARIENRLDPQRVDTEPRNFVESSGHVAPFPIPLEDIRRHLVDDRAVDPGGVVISDVERPDTVLTDRHVGSRTSLRPGDVRHCEIEIVLSGRGAFGDRDACRRIRRGR